MKEDIIEEYTKLKTRHKLPDFEALDKEFEISSLDNGSFLLNGILKKEISKFDEYLKLLNSIFSPDTSSSASMHECRVFDDDEKKGLYTLFRNLMILTRKCDIIILNYNEHEAAELIKRSANEWNGLKKEITKAMEKLIQSWEKDADIKEEVGYLG